MVLPRSENQNLLAELVANGRLFSALSPFATDAIKEKLSANRLSLNGGHEDRKIIANWRPKNGRLPINFTVAKLGKVNKQPISVTAGVSDWAESPDGCRSVRFEAVREG
ncbi:hypothetical protein FHS21_005683 [Phyllobacterium trifolii]|uniref:Uncharacterized protein n=1 Tax=Phyllobacterium trifolii TaxID=300193 RepID=A0A839UKT4_9HYPH|nr:hypothetical protein [Phyllobacterium trifolii]